MNTYSNTPEQYMNLTHILHRIQFSKCGVLFDIDETLLSCIGRWQEYIRSELKIELTQRQIELSGSVDNYFYNSAFQARFIELANKLRADIRFNSGLPLVEGSKVAIKILESIPYLKLAGYITSRPDSISECTISDLDANNFPFLPLVSRPLSVDYSSSIMWKLNILAEINTHYDGYVIMVDDSIELAAAIRNHNNSEQCCIVSILLVTPYNRLGIINEKITTDGDSCSYVATWNEIPDICKKYANL